MVTLSLDMGIAAVIGAIVASLVAPFANWGVEKKRNRLKWRKELINHCKRRICEHGFWPGIFIETSYYSNLKPHLSKKLQEDVKMKSYVPGKMIDVEKRKEITRETFRIKKRLLDEINILEKKWGLI